MVGESWVPDFETVVGELRQLRDVGLTGLRRLRPRALGEVARRADLITADDAQPAAIEELLRRAADRLGGGLDQEIAEYTFGLAAGYRMRSATERRHRAAQLYGVKADSFRKEPERLVIEQMAEGVLAVAREAAMRQTRLDMERRHPADSRLAVQWVERFEAYNRIWTPVYGLGADLLAAMETYRHEPADHLPWDPDSEQTYDPVAQAEMYMTHALCHYARFQLEVRRFISRHGGLWLLSDADVEQQVSDAVYRIGWYNNLPEDDDSWLRRNLVDARHEENDHFVQLLTSTATGARILEKWQEMGRNCQCTDVTDGDDPSCHVHNTIRACHDYTDLIEADWLRIADWYRPGSRPQRGVEAVALYDAHVSAVKERRPGNRQLDNNHSVSPPA